MSSEDISKLNIQESNSEDDLPPELWIKIFDNLDLRDLATLSMTSKRFRELSLETMRHGTGWEWRVTPEQVLKCPESYATWFARVPSLGLKIEDILWWSVDDALSVEDIETATRMIKAGQLPEYFIRRKANSVKIALMTSEYGSYFNSTTNVTTAASMAKMGIITNVERMDLEDNIDISSIPSDNMAALCSVVTDWVGIEGVTGNVQTILANVKCKELGIADMNLDHDDTECLLEAMRNNVEDVELYYDVSLDIDVLTQYDGLGKCGKLWCWWDETLSNWASAVGWKYNGHNNFQRK